MKNNTIILVVVVLAVIGAIVFLEGQKATPTTTNDVMVSDDNLAPEFQNIAAWINSEPLTMEELKGKVVLIDFWTYSCINCIRTQPYLNAWHDKYHDKGLVIVGVHTPEFAFEKELANVQGAVTKENILYPVALDNGYSTWRAYENRYWPRKYLIDKNGIIRYDHIGEGGYKETEEVIQTLLKELGEKLSDDKVTVKTHSVTTRNTPELYTGYNFALTRGQDIGNEKGLQVEKTVEYTLPATIKKDIIYLEGLWKTERDSIVAKSDGLVVLKFTATNANIVADADNQTIMVSIDGVEKSLLINDPTLYEVFDGEYGTYTLKLVVKEGFSLHSFTFG